MEKKFTAGRILFLTKMARPQRYKGNSTDFREAERGCFKPTKITQEA